MRLIILIILIFSPLNSFSAAWTQSKGSKQIIASINRYQATNYFDSNGDKKSSGQKFTKWELNPFIEYGLTDDITIGVNPLFQSWNFKKNDPTRAVFDFRQCGLTNNSLSEASVAEVFELELFLRKKIYQKDNLVISVQPLVKSPCFISSGNRSFIAKQTFDAELRGLIGYGFKWELEDNKKRPFAGQYHFVNFETAYRKRSSRFADQIKIDGSAGFRFNKDLLFLGQIFSVISNGDEITQAIETTPGSFFFRKDNFATIKGQLSAVQQLTKNTSIQFSYSDELWGKNSGNGNSAILSLWYSF